MQNSMAWSELSWKSQRCGLLACNSHNINIEIQQQGLLYPRFLFTPRYINNTFGIPFQ